MSSSQDEIPPRQKSVNSKRYFTIDRDDFVPGRVSSLDEISRVNTLSKSLMLDSPEACSFIKKETLAQVHSCEFCEIFRNTFFHRTPLVAASDLSHILCWLSWYYNFYFPVYRSTMSGNALIRK